ncbi:MAG: glycosyltransferase family 4 protein [Ferrimicrobium sp.]
MTTASLRIAFTLYRGNPNSGGQGVYTRYLTRELAALGHRVTVFSGPPYPTVDPGVSLRRLYGLDLFRDPDPFRLPRPREFRDLAAFGELALMATGAFPDPKAFGWRIARALDPGEFDIVHDNQSLNWALVRLLDKGLAVTASIHHPVTVDRRLALETTAGLKRRIGLKRFYGFVAMQASVARRLTRVLTVSHSAANDLSRELGIERSRISVVPIGVDAERFHPIVSVSREDRLICTTASADVPLKGLRYLVEAVALLPGTRLIVMGAKSTDSGIMSVVDNLGLASRVHFAGSVDHSTMVQTYARASVAVVPSLYEGFSLPAVEAMACGVPLVVAKGGALPEVVGDAASLSEVASAKALAEAIAAVLGDPKGSLERAVYARRRVVERFSWRCAAEATVEEYRRVIKESNG